MFTIVNIERGSLLEKWIQKTDEALLFKEVEETKKKGYDGVKDHFKLL